MFRRSTRHARDETRLRYPLLPPPLSTAAAQAKAMDFLDGLLGDVEKPPERDPEVVRFEKGVIEEERLPSPREEREKSLLLLIALPGNPHAAQRAEAKKRAAAEASQRDEFLVEVGGETGH